MIKNLRKNLWLEANQICMASGHCVASNVMFETKKDHQLFLEYWQKYLGEMADVIHYHLTEEGWHIMFKTRSALDIKRAYTQQRMKSQKAKKECTYMDVRRMLSEHFRIFLSQYVRRTNVIHGRKGTKVMERFKKYIFHDKIDYEKVFRLFMKQYKESPQQTKKYRPDEGLYDSKMEMKSDSIWKVGSRIYDGLEKWDTVWKSFALMPPQYYVLRKYLKNLDPPKISSFSP